MKYLIIAGDYSGQNHGIELMKAILEVDLEAEFLVFGSKSMIINQHSNLIYDLESLKIMGFAGILSRFFEILSVIKLCKTTIKKEKIDCLILIDFGGFNLRIAKFAHQLGVKILYFIPPKVWAWNESRIKILRKNVDKIAVIFDFERKYFQTKGTSVSYFGNPMAEKKNKNQNDRDETIALLPGSRQLEVNLHLPIFIKLAKINLDIEFTLAGLKNLNYSFELPPNLRIEYNQTENLLKTSKFAFICSGTATFEAALYQIPHIVCYKTSWLNYQISKLLIKVKFIALPNLILNKSTIPELIQSEMNVANLQKYIQKSEDLPFKNQQIEAFKEIREIEKGLNVYKNVAQLAINLAKKC